MRDRSRIALTFAGLGLASALAPLAVAAWLGQPIALPHVLGGLSAAVAFSFAWSRVDHLLLRPGERLAADVEAWLADPGQDRHLEEIGVHGLDQLPAAIDRLCVAARTQRQGLRQAARIASDRAEERRAWLDVGLRDLVESVVVCGLDHRILFHNRAAEQLLNGVEDGVGLGRLVPQVSLDHALGCLRARMAAFGAGCDGLIGTSLFSCLTGGGKRLLHGQMSLVLNPRQAATGYVVVFRDMNEARADLDPGDSVRQALVRDLRGSLGALYAAAQMLLDYPAMEIADRTGFVKVITEESLRMSTRLCAPTRTGGDLPAAVWPMADIHFSELFSCIAAALEQRLDIRLTMVGVPLWLHGDSHSLMEAFLALFSALHAQTGRSAFDMECMLGDRRVYVDVNWEGEPVPDGRLTRWLEAEINTALGPQRVTDVLERHDSQPWSLAKRSCFAALRIPLPLARRAQFTAEEWAGLGSPPSLSEADIRAELLLRSDADGVGGGKLDRMPFLAVSVVTPRHAAREGDRLRITAIGAVRIEAGRLLTARTFERRLASGAADEAEEDGKPPLAVVLPQFWQFAGDAVLAVHDIGPCLGLLEAREAGGRPQPVIDTMVVSRMLDPDEADHSLAAVARRLGIRVGDHRTEIGKALLTGEVLVRQMDRLRDARITDFAQLAAAVRDYLTGAENLAEV